MLFAERRRLVELAAKNRLPAVYAFREFVDVGGLMSYGGDLADLIRRAATYVDKILKGTKPGDLPVEQPTKLDLVINLKAAEPSALRFRRRCWRGRTKSSRNDQCPPGWPAPRVAGQPPLKLALTSQAEMTTASRMGQFMDGFVAAAELLQRAAENGFFIEDICLAASVIDGSLRIGLILQHQLETRSSALLDELLLQTDADAIVSEREIYRRAAQQGVIDGNLAHVLEELYTKRNRVFIGSS